jgi:hypothetical protein
MNHFIERWSLSYLLLGNADHSEICHFQGIGILLDSFFGTANGTSVSVYVYVWDK